MKSLGLVLTLMISTFGSEARAQSGLDAFVYSMAAADASFGIAGLVTGLGSSGKVAQGEFSKPWFIASYATGGVNLALAAVSLYGAIELHYGFRVGFHPLFAGVALGHAAVGLWNVVMATMGFYRGGPSGEVRPILSPVMLTGRGGSGHRWSGLGVQIAGF